MSRFEWFTRGGRVGALLFVGVMVWGGCTAQEDAGESAEMAAEGDHGHAHEVVATHGGRVVELTGPYDAELLVAAGGMAYVYLYDDEGHPQPWEGKEVSIVVTTPDGEMHELPMEGMGSGSGAHFMNPIPEAMVAHIMEQGAYTTDITLVTDEGTHTGSIDIVIDE